MSFGPRFEIPHTVGEESFTVVMRGIQDGDAESLSDLLGNYPAQQFVMISGSPSVQDEQEWLERVRTDSTAVSWLISVTNWSVKGVPSDSDTDRFVGTTGLHHTLDKFLSSGILLANQAWWGKGIASLTHQFRTWFAFQELGAYGINSSYVDGNEASGKALRGVGYADCGRVYRNHFTAGTWRDEVLLCCYNPATVALLWPDGDIPPAIEDGLEKTRKALERAEGLIKAR